jgi:hypothetical protein
MVADHNVLTSHIHGPMSQYHLLYPPIYILSSPERIDTKNQIKNKKQNNWRSKGHEKEFTINTYMERIN